MDPMANFFLDNLHFLPLLRGFCKKAAFVIQTIDPNYLYTKEG